MKLSTLFTLATVLATSGAVKGEEAQMLPITLNAEVKVVCGDAAIFCGADKMIPAELGETHEVRCCSDTFQSGWEKHPNCDVWTESDLVPVGGGSPSCHHMTTYEQAVAICKANDGARLCTEDEMMDGCTRLSGCGHDQDHIWTSTMTGHPATESKQVAIEVATPPPADSYVYLACGDVNRRRGCSARGHFWDVAKLEEQHEVRCCSDSALSGWRKNRGCGVWSDSDMGGQCYHSSTYIEASDICARNGGRLCTKEEVLGRCTRRSGCGHDEDLVWTSTVAPAKVAAAVEAGTLTELSTQSSTQICTGPSASVKGDPHLHTFDGFRYDCQGKGEFVLVSSKGDDDPLAIHGRFVGGSTGTSLSVTRSVAIKVDEDVPVIQVTVPDYYNETIGCPFSFSYGEDEAGIPSDQVSEHFLTEYAGQATYFTTGKNLIFTYPDYGARVEVTSRVSGRNFGCVLNVDVCLTPEKHGGADNIVGLMGSPNGVQGDDWMNSASGAIVPIPTGSKRDVMQHALDYCVDNWCVANTAGSLYNDENFNKYNNCTEKSFDAEELLTLVEELSPEVLEKCEGTEDPFGCEIDAAFGTEGTELDPMDIVDAIIEEERESTELHTLVDIDDCGEESHSEPENGSVAGDPHFKTWKKEHFEYHGQCDLILAKDDKFADGLGLEVQIRTKLVRFWSYIKNVAIRIGDDILEVQGNADPNDDGKQYWINFEYQGELNTLGGFPVSLKSPTTVKSSFEIDLSSKYPGVTIVVEFYKEFVRVDFQNGSEEAFGNTIGMLGNYNSGKTLARDGSTELHDFSEFGNEWQVLPFEHMLFHDVEQPQFPKKCLEPEDPRGDRRRRLGESTISETEAENACASISDPLDRKDCIYDILATQDIDMVGAY